MTQPYTYLVKNTQTNQVYYGCRYAKGCNPSEFWVTYFSSSKYVKELIEQYGKESFVFEIRKTFTSVANARLWEHKVLRRMKVVKDNRFINKTDNKSISPDSASKAQKGKTGSLCPAFGRKNAKLSEFNRQNVGHKNHMFGKTGELAPCYGRVGEKHPMYGKKHSEESKKKISAKTSTCMHCGKVANVGNINRWHNYKCKNKE